MASTMPLAIDELKELLADPRNRIKLDDFITQHVRAFLDATSVEHFPVQGGSVTKEAFVSRVEAYEAALVDLQQIVILLARWGDDSAVLVLEKLLARVAESGKESSGIVLWINLAWYPLSVLMYAAGISALSARRYQTLKVVLLTEAETPQDRRQPLALLAGSHLSSLNDAWKWVPGHERHYTPRSEYLFARLRATLEDLLFIGSSYEHLFDTFEIYSALVYAHANGGDYGPIGRFGWKNDREEMIVRLMNKAKGEGSTWAPLSAGLFDGSVESFITTTEAFKQRLHRLPWG